MRERIDALPVVARGRLQLDGCVTSDDVYRSAVTQVVRWRCRHDGPALRAERAHTAYVLSILSAGACTLHDGAWSVTLDPATAILHRPGAAYYTRHPFGVVDRGWSIAFPESVVDEALVSLGVDMDRWERPSRTVAPRGDTLRDLVALHQLALAKPVDPLAFEELSLAVLHDALHAIAVREPTARAPSTRAAHRRLVNRARDYVNAHLQAPLRLETLGDAVGASPFHLCRVFKAGTGMTLRAYARHLRLAAALDALMRGERSLARIAVECGFASHSHLTTAFVAAYGVPPRQVRNQLHLDPQWRS